jgi:hypothetical protein
LGFPNLLFQDGVVNLQLDQVFPKVLDVPGLNHCVTDQGQVKRSQQPSKSQQTQQEQRPLTVQVPSFAESEIPDGPLPARPTRGPGSLVSHQRGFCLFGIPPFLRHCFPYRLISKFPLALSAANPIFSAARKRAERARGLAITSAVSGRRGLGVSTRTRAR